jgi:hypothetical protein
MRLERAIVKKLWCAGLAVLVVAPCALIGSSSAVASECGGPTPCSASRIRVECIVTGTNPYTDEALVAARVKAIMRNKAGNGNYMHAYRIRARLIPTTAGTNIGRAYNENKDDGVRPFLDNVRNMVVVTPSENAGDDWNVQVQMTWDRSRGKPDWHYNRVFGFTEEFCAA